MINSIRIVPQSNLKKVSTDMNFIAQTAFLGLCQGFHEKMIDDTIQNIRDMGGLSHKQRQREIGRMYKHDSFVINATNVSQEAAKLLSEFDFFIDDPDLKAVWLVIDRFLTEHMMKNTFIVALGAFSLIADDLAGITDSQLYDDLQRKLYKMANTISDEYYEYRKDRMAENGNHYDRFVFGFFEDSELTKARSAGESFLSIFTSRDTFNKYANDYFESLSNRQKEYFTNLFIIVDDKQ